MIGAQWEIGGKSKRRFCKAIWTIASLIIDHSISYLDLVLSRYKW